MQSGACWWWPSARNCSRLFVMNSFGSWFDKSFCLLPTEPFVIHDTRNLSLEHSINQTEIKAIFNRLAEYYTRDITSLFPWYCHKCAAWVTMPKVTNKRCGSGIAFKLYNGDTCKMILSYKPGISLCIPPPIKVANTGYHGLLGDSTSFLWIHPRNPFYSHSKDEGWNNSWTLRTLGVTCLLIFPKGTLIWTYRHFTKQWIG